MRDQKSRTMLIRRKQETTAILRVWGAVCVREREKREN